MDWFLYNKDLRHKRVNTAFFLKKMSLLAISKVLWVFVATAYCRKQYGRLSRNHFSISPSLFINLIRCVICSLILFLNMLYFSSLLTMKKSSTYKLKRNFNSCETFVHIFCDNRRKSRSTVKAVFKFGFTA